MRMLLWSVVLSAWILIWALEAETEAKQLHRSAARAEPRGGRGSRGARAHLAGGVVRPAAPLARRVSCVLGTCGVQKLKQLLYELGRNDGETTHNTRDPNGFGK